MENDKLTTIETEKLISLLSWAYTAGWKDSAKVILESAPDESIMINLFKEKLKP